MIRDLIDAAKALRRVAFAYDAETLRRFDSALAAFEAQRPVTVEEADRAYKAAWSKESGLDYDNRWGSSPRLAGIRAVLALCGRGEQGGVANKDDTRTPVGVSSSETGDATPPPTICECGHAHTIIYDGTKFFYRDGCGECPCTTFSERKAESPLVDDAEGRGPCGGKRCFLDSHALASGQRVWVHSSKSYGTCSVRRGMSGMVALDQMKERKAETRDLMPGGVREWAPALTEARVREIVREELRPLESRSYAANRRLDDLERAFAPPAVPSWVPSVDEIQDAVFNALTIAECEAIISLISQRAPPPDRSSAQGLRDLIDEVASRAASEIAHIRRCLEDRGVPMVRNGARIVTAADAPDRSTLIALVPSAEELVDLYLDGAYLTAEEGIAAVRAAIVEALERAP